MFFFNPLNPASPNSDHWSRMITMSNTVTRSRFVKHPNERAISDHTGTYNMQNFRRVRLVRWADPKICPPDDHFLNFRLAQPLVPLVGWLVGLDVQYFYELDAQTIHPYCGQRRFGRCMDGEEVSSQKVDASLSGCNYRGGLRTTRPTSTWFLLRLAPTKWIES